MGPSSRIVLWDTLLDGRFSTARGRRGPAHELGASLEQPHREGDRLVRAVRAARRVRPDARHATARRDGRPAAVPLALLVAAILSLVMTPGQNLVSRRWRRRPTGRRSRRPATRRCPRAVREFAMTSLGDPSPPTWAYLCSRPTPPSRNALRWRTPGRRGAAGRARVSRPTVGDHAGDRERRRRARRRRVADVDDTGASWKTKSSNSVPSGASACARMPDGPGSTSATSSSGRSFRAEPTKRRVERSRDHLCRRPSASARARGGGSPASGAPRERRAGRRRAGDSPRARTRARRSGRARRRHPAEPSCGSRGTGTPGPAPGRPARATRCRRSGRSTQVVAAERHDARLGAAPGRCGEPVGVDARARRRRATPRRPRRWSRSTRHAVAGAKRATSPRRAGARRPRPRRRRRTPRNQA